ncbi:MAG: DUF4160 domain-containing protein [Verrucomicrobiales bacterium]|nr:DUF4160 domain-containing protein [Verrucomicrobiales bacterium]
MDKPLTAVRDYAQIIQATIDGKKPLVVGGQAVNIWALNYERQIAADLAPYRPFMSKDIDLYGSIDLLDALHRQFGGAKKVPPHRAGTVMVGFRETEQHHLPHIHADYQDAEVSVAIEDGRVLGGGIDPRKLKLVQAWVELHREELLADWKLARAGQALYQIQPLR